MAAGGAPDTGRRKGAVPETAPLRRHRDPAGFVPIRWGGAGGTAGCGLTGIFPVSSPPGEGEHMKAKEWMADGDLFKGAIADFEKHIVVSALEQTGGNQRKAALRLGTTRRILSYRIQKYGIDLVKICQNAKRPTS
jgi:DNA-binding NtrC family response regulator